MIDIQDNIIELEAEIRKVIENTTEKKISALGLDDNILKTMGLDSMTALEIMAAMEARFKIRIPEQDFAKITTLRSVMEVVTKHLNKKKELKL